MVIRKWRAYPREGSDPGSGLLLTGNRGARTPLDGCAAGLILAASAGSRAGTGWSGSGKKRGTEEVARQFREALPPPICRTAGRDPGRQPGAVSVLGTPGQQHRCRRCSPQDSGSLPMRRPRQTYARRSRTSRSRTGAVAAAAARRPRRRGSRAAGQGSVSSGAARTPPGRIHRGRQATCGAG